MGKSWDEFTKSLNGFKDLGIKGIWDAFINGSTEAGDQLEKDKSLIEDFKKVFLSDIDESEKTKQQADLMQQMSAQASVYVKQMDKATLSADDFAASQTRAAVAMNTLQGVGKKAIAVVGNMLTTFAISAVVNLAIQGITWLIERQENLRQAALEAGSALDEQTSSINSYKEQISSLRESLDEGNLSENEAYEARKQLISIQDELVEKFGSEADGIDLVNGKYEEQLDILNDISDSKANSYLTEHYDKIKEAQQEMMKQRSYMTDRETTYITATDADSERLRKIMGKYTDQGVQYFDRGRTNPFTNKKRIDFTITADASQAKETLESLYSDISKDSQLSEETKSAINSQISEWSNQAQDTLDKWESTSETGTKYLIQTNKSWSKLYDDLEEAQNDYTEAVAKNDDEAIAAAIQKGKAAREAIRTSDDFSGATTNDRYVKQYLNAQADELEESTKLKAAQIGLQEVLKTGNTLYKESQKAVAGLTEAQKQYGNVSNVNRDAIKWTAENMENYAAAIKTNGWKVQEGDWSTAEGTYNEFGEGKNQIEIAYTPMLQTDDGLVPLTDWEIARYMNHMVDAATDKTGKIDTDKLFELDASGMMMAVNGKWTKVQNMIAAAEGQIVDGAKLTGADVAAIAGESADKLMKRFGHTSDYVGKSMHDIQDETLKYKTVAKDAFDDIDYSALTDYLDITEEDAKNIVDTIKSSVQSLNGLNDLDLLDIGSLENAGTEITAYNKEQVQAYDNMSDAADKLGISMSDLIDILVKAGLVTGESIKYTNEFTTNALSAATNATKAISLVTAAMQSQSTTAGVSSDSYSELIKEQGEYAAALDFENGYVKLNTDMAKKITQAKIDEAEANIKLAYSQNQMKYSQVKADLEALNTAVQQNGKLEGENAEQVEKARSELEAQSQQLRENCRNLQMQYSLLVQNSGAYQDWVNAQNASEAGDMYDSVIKAKQAIAEGLKNGKIGTEKFKAAVELTIPDDYQGDIAKYMKKLNRYFKQAKDGSADASGLNNFITDSIKAGLMSKEADNQIKIAANKTTKDFADALHLSMEDVQSIWGELQEYGWEFDWGSLLGNPIDNLRMQIDDIQDQMDALGDDAENSPVWQALNEQLTTLQDKLKETFSSADASEINQSIEDIIDEATKANGVLTEGQMDTIRAAGRAQNLYELVKAQEELTEKQKEYNEATSADNAYTNNADQIKTLAAELQAAQDKVTTLTQNKEKLQQPTPLEVSTFALDYAQGKIDGVKHTTQETSDMLASMGCSVDTSSADTAMDTENQKAEQFTKTLSNVPVTLDTSTCQSKISTVSKAIDGLKREVPITLNFGVTGTVLSVVSGGLSVFGSKSKGSKSSGNHNSAAGTPNSPGGKTLVGEIGNELVVNPHTGKWYTVGDNGAEFVNLPHGAIVFDHEKTQKLLNNGFVGGYGDALVSGNAMDAGSPGNGSYVGTAGNNYLPGTNPLVKNTYKATTASTKATKENTKALEKNKKALEKQKTALEKQKTALEKESNKLKIYGQAAIDEIEKREKELNKQKDAQDKAFEAEIDHLNEIKDAKDKELDAETKRIKAEKDAKDKAWEKEKKQLEEKKEALQDANDEEDRAIKLAELKDALAKAQANRTVRIYNRNQGFIWAADQEAVNEAQTALDDQMRDWKRDDVIKAVEDEIDAIDKLKDAYDEETENRLDDIDKEKEAFDEKIEAEIEDINKRKDAYDKAIEAEIEKLDEVKEKWNEAMSLIGTSWEDYQLQLAAAAHFTDMSLDGMSGEISDYKDDVLANMKEIGGVTDQIDAITESIEKLEEAISDAKDAASGSGSGSGTTDPSLSFGASDPYGVDPGDDVLTAQAAQAIDSFKKLEDQIQATANQTIALKDNERDLAEQLSYATEQGLSAFSVMKDYHAVQGDIADGEAKVTELTRQYMQALVEDSSLTQEAKNEKLTAYKEIADCNAEMHRTLRASMVETASAIISNSDLSKSERAKEMSSMLELADTAGYSYNFINDVAATNAEAIIENTGTTNGQRKLQIDSLKAFTDEHQLSADTIKWILQDNLAAVTDNTDLTGEQRNRQIDSVVAMADTYGIKYDEILPHLESHAAAVLSNKDTTAQASDAMLQAVQRACRDMNVSYDSTISKINQMVEAYKQAQAEIDAMPHVKTNRGEQIVSAGKGYAGRYTEYATGVLNAAATHIAITDEKGPEIKMRKPSSGQYSLIEKGSSVIPAQPSANLWKFGLDPEAFIAAHTSQRSIKSVEITQPNMSSGMTMGDVTIQMYGVNDPDSFARVLHDRVGGIFAQEFSKR